MGSIMSTHSTPEIKDSPRSEAVSQRSVSGRKESESAEKVLAEEPHLISTDEEVDKDSFDSSSGDEYDEESGCYAESGDEEEEGT
jgi:hypothetical protein